MSSDSASSSSSKGRKSERSRSSYDSPSKSGSSSSEVPVKQEPEAAVFTRNPPVEQAAVKVLGYSVDQVKRRTVAQLTRELEALKPPPSVVATVTPKKHVTFAQAGDLPKAKAAAVPVAASDGKRVAQHIFALEEVLQAKRVYTATLEQDADFTDADLEDWDHSIAVLQRQLDSLKQQHAEELKALWTRRQQKLKVMEQRGLLEPPELARKWAEKQQQLKASFE